MCFSENHSGFSCKQTVRNSELDVDPPCDGSCDNAAPPWGAVATPTWEVTLKQWLNLVWRSIWKRLSHDRDVLNILLPPRSELRAAEESE